ncbi:hypothetical protein C8R44DRAFT_724480 [Mycena epipterygia]|nr:hypothetical protein C8R44DRAFT_724480 [Mycena epipterygia]
MPISTSGVPKFGNWQCDCEGPATAPRCPAEVKESRLGVLRSGDSVKDHSQSECSLYKPKADIRDVHEGLLASQVRRISRHDYLWEELFIGLGCLQTRICSLSWPKRPTIPAEIMDAGARPEKPKSGVHLCFPCPPLAGGTCNDYGKVLKLASNVNLIEAHIKIDFDNPSRDTVTPSLALASVYDGSLGLPHGACFDGNSFL